MLNETQIRIWFMYGYNT